MQDEEKDKKEAADRQEGLGTISRRKFAMGSMAIIGAGAASLSPSQANVPAWKIEKSEEVRKLMDERHILDDDIIKVIEHAEKTGAKLYQKDTDAFLSKLYMGEAYFYAEYSPVEGGYRIHTAYSHRFTLEEG
jgi:hypothetical protein